MSAIQLTPVLATAAAAMLELQAIAPRIASAHDGKSPIILFDAGPGNDRVTAGNVHAAAALLSKAKLPVPPLHALTDDVFFVRGEPDPTAPTALLQQLHGAHLPELPSDGPAYIYNDLTPFLRIHVPEITGRPLPSAASDELQALLRGSLPVWLGPDLVPTFGAPPLTIRFNLERNQPVLGLLPLCDLRLSTPERDGLARSDGQTNAMPFFAMLAAWNHGTPGNLSDPRLHSFKLWYRRWIDDVG